MNIIFYFCSLNFLKNNIILTQYIVTFYKITIYSHYIFKQFFTIQLLDIDQAKKIVRKGFLLLKISIVYTLMKSALSIFGLALQFNQGYFGLLTFVEASQMSFYISMFVSTYYKQYLQICNHNSLKYPINEEDYMNIYNMISHHVIKAKAQNVLYVLIKIVNFITLLYGTIIIQTFMDQDLIIFIVFIATQLTGYVEFLLQLINYLNKLRHSQTLRKHAIKGIKEPCSICLQEYKPDQNIVQLRCDALIFGQKNSKTAPYAECSSADPQLPYIGAK
ncbi:hypothetical protein pb186bvf_019576 [Paramecium bursaria]